MDKRILTIHQQVKKLLPLMVLIYIPVLMVLAALIVVYATAGIPLRIFFTDPIAEFNSPMYLGFVSNLGVLLWGAAAATCLFAGWFIRESQPTDERAWFLISSGLFSALLMLDDLYLLHEQLFENHLFLPQEVVLATYGLLAIVLIYRFRQVILGTDFVLLLIAFVLLGISAGVDLLVKPEEFELFGVLPGRDIVEDGFKLLGIATWSLYFVRTSGQEVKRLPRPV